MTQRAPADELAHACSVAMYARDRAAQTMGITVVETRAGFARAEMTVGDSMLNGHDIAHGGFVFTLADTAFAYACNSRNDVNVALQCSISFAAAARRGDRLVALGQQRTGSRGRTGVYDVSVVRGDDEEVVALFRGVCYRVRGTVVPVDPEAEP